MTVQGIKLTDTNTKKKVILFITLGMSELELVEFIQRKLNLNLKDQNNQKYITFIREIVRLNGQLVIDPRYVNKKSQEICSKTIFDRLFSENLKPNLCNNLCEAINNLLQEYFSNDNILVEEWEQVFNEQGKVII